MSRRRAKPFPPWQSPARGGVEKSFIRLGHALMRNEEVRKLSPNAFRLYVFMLDEAKGEREFIFPRTCYRDLMSTPTFSKARDELIKAGFIRMVASNANLRKPSKFEFCLKWPQA